MFLDTLTYLSLDYFTTSFVAFVTLVDYFPNITTLRLRSISLKPDEGPIPSLSRPLRGKICVHVQSHCLEFLDLFAKLDLEYKELEIGPPGFSTGIKAAGSILQISTRTVKLERE